MALSSLQQPTTGTTVPAALCSFVARFFFGGDMRAGIHSQILAINTRRAAVLDDAFTGAQSLPRPVIVVPRSDNANTVRVQANRMRQKERGSYHVRIGHRT